MDFERVITLRVQDCMSGKWFSVRVRLKDGESPYYDGMVIDLERERMKRQVGTGGDDWKPV